MIGHLAWSSVLFNRWLFKYVKQKNPSTRDGFASLKFKEMRFAVEPALPEVNPNAVGHIVFGLVLDAF